MSPSAFPKHKAGINREVDENIKIAVVGGVIAVVYFFFTENNHLYYGLLSTKGCTAMSCFNPTE